MLPACQADLQSAPIIHSAARKRTGNTSFFFFFLFYFWKRAPNSLSVTMGGGMRSQQKSWVLLRSAAWLGAAAGSSAAASTVGDAPEPGTPGTSRTPRFRGEATLGGRSPGWDPLTADAPMRRKRELGPRGPRLPGDCPGKRTGPAALPPPAPAGETPGAGAVPAGRRDGGAAVCGAEEEIPHQPNPTQPACR